MRTGRISAVLASVMVGAAGVASGQPPENRDTIPDTPGTGPFAPIKEIDPGLPDQVVYRPADLAGLGETKLGLYVFGMDDYEKIDHVPIAVANIDKGHGGTYWEPNGGAVAEVVIDWLDWQLRGSTQASRVFAGRSCGLCGDPAWEYKSKGL